MGAPKTNQILAAFNEDKECRRMDICFLFQKVGHERRLGVGEVKRFSLAQKNQEMNGNVQ